MKYRNRKSGEIIDSPCKLGGNWEKIGAEPEKAPAIPAPVKAEEPAEVEEPVKPKRRSSSRKTKK